MRERVKALQRQQEQFDGADIPALAVMTAGDIEASMDASSARMDELMAGDVYYHSLTEKG